MGAKWFGAAVKRKEDPALLAGKGRFVDDIPLPGMLHAAFVRSAHPHAMIRGIDAAAARKLPGVHAVVTFADLPEPVRKTALPLFVPSPAITQLHLPYALAEKETVYAGEPIAVVVAESREVAEDAAALVAVDYEPLPAVADAAAAIEPGAPLAHAYAPSNIAARMPIAAGDVEKAFAGAAHVVAERIRIHRGGPFFMECRGIVASYDTGADSYMVYVSSQGAHRIKRGLMDVLDLNDNQMHVVTPDVGGGFGPKGAIYPEYPCIAACAKLTGRPVKWIEDRRENFLTTHQERDQFWDLELAADRAGTILGLRGRLVHDTGAYVPWGLVLPWIAATTVPGPYVIPHFRIEVVAVYTNMISTTPVRGAGRPQGVFVMERMMDRLAAAAGLDRAEVRRRNFIAPERMPYRVGIISRDGRPVTYDSGDYPASQAAALAAADYDNFAARQAAARDAGRHIGIGISNAVESTGLGPYEGATVRIATNGKIVLYTGATPQGQSHKTTLAQIAADPLGVSYEDVTVATADTKEIAFGVGTFAARTAVNAGSSAHIAAIEVAKKIKKIAADMMEVSPDDLELRDGFACVRGVPGMKTSFRDIAVKSIGMPGFSMAGGLAPGLENTAYFQPDQSTYSNGTHIAEVDVDIETGAVKIVRYTVLHDCGTVINPMVVEGQVVGGVAHGIGNALFERLVHDEGAEPQTVTFADYLLPTAPEMPPIAVHHTETPSPLNPLGLKGAGEGGTIAAIAAIIGAVENALAPFGVRINEAPIDPPRIVALLAAARAGR
jgi:carbon-monoxide dehydrogenase large subunit